MVKRICHITSVHSANDVRIFYKECLSLSKEYEVFEIAPNTQDTVKQGIHIAGVTLPHSRWTRPLFLSRVLRKALEINAEVYHLHDPELISLGLKLKRRGKKVIFDSHEDVPMQLLTKEYLPNYIRKPLSAIYAKHERNCLKHYDALVTVTPTILDRLLTINQRSVMVTNYPPYHDVPRSIPTDNIPRVCFAGGVDKSYMHHCIVSSLPQTRVRYQLAGNCPFPYYLDDLKKIDGWKQVDYLGVVPPEDVEKIYAKSDIGLVLLDYLPNAGYHRGTLGVLKLFEYMMAGLPVIATDMEIWKDIVEGNHCGICIDPHDSNAIAKSINYIIDNPNEAKLMGKNGKRAVREKYNWSTQEEILLKLYSELTV